MNYTEEAILFDCVDETLVGILARPETPARTGLVVIVGGPQYRAGSHRQFVLLSRSLAAEGYAVLRFDYRGMGDSSGDKRDFLTVNDDIGSAIGILQRSVPSIKKIVLWGLCDAASASLLYCHATQNLGVNGLCLLNPWVRSEASLACTRMKHYYTQRLMKKEFWRKLLRGDVATSAISNLMRNIRVATTGGKDHFHAAAIAPESPPTQQTYQNDMAITWSGFSGCILLFLSGEDFTAKEFISQASTDANWQGALRHSRLVRHDMPGADHTFSNSNARNFVTRTTGDWLGEQTK